MPIMFGTLVFTDMDQGTLEFVENPDSVAAVSRNLRDKIHISCMFCRARKVRCSGGKKCQRCASMNLECVYPEKQGRSKRPVRSRSRRTTPQPSSRLPERPVSSDVDQCLREGLSTNSQQQLTLNGLDDLTFDDSGIDGTLFTPWLMDTSANASLDGRFSLSSSDTLHSFDLASELSFLTRSPSTTTANSASRREFTMAETPSMSLVSPSASKSAGDADSWDNQLNIGSASGSPALERTGSPRIASDSCSCLVSSISFLERLISRSATHETRIDLLLADVRNAVETLNIFVSCDRCALRMEQNMLLAMAARQISAICTKTAHSYNTIFQREMAGTGSSLSSSLSSTASSSSPRQPPLDSASGAVDISISSYRVNRRERLHLLKSLITLQIADLQQHVSSIKSCYLNQVTQGQAEALIEADKNIKMARAVIGRHS